MAEATFSVTMKGNPVNLTGSIPEIGQAVPETGLVAQDLSVLNLSSLKGQQVLISVVPSLDTPVCDVQTKRFHQELLNLKDDITILTVSMDLPFAQKRWCGQLESAQDRFIVASDHRLAEFGQNFGVLITDLRLLIRAVFVLDENGVLQYRQIVPEITTEPNYDDVLSFIKSA